jgi:hypothetical protein
LPGGDENQLYETLFAGENFTRLNRLLFNELMTLRHGIIFYFFAGNAGPCLMR